MNLINKKTLEYPVTFQQFKRKFPNISFPNNIDNIDFNKYNYSIVQEVSKPFFNSSTQKLVELKPVYNEESNTYIQKWGIENSINNMEELEKLQKVIQKQDERRLLKEEKDDLSVNKFSDWEEIQKMINNISDLDSSKVLLTKIARTLFLLVNVE